MLIEVLVGAIVGFILAILMQKVAVAQIDKRTQDKTSSTEVSSSKVLVLWGLLLTLLFTLLFFLDLNILQKAEYLIYIAVAVHIAVVDISIKKIPNEMLLVLLATKTITIVVALVQGGSFKSDVLPALIGFAVAFILFFIPSLFKVYIGAGDIKYCGVIGFCLGIGGFLQAAAIMGIALSVYLIYLLAFKRTSLKASLKTATAMGPYLSLGVVFTILFPLTVVTEFFAF